MKKAIFFDRDGVINKAYIKDGLPFSPNSLNELEILPGVKKFILDDSGVLPFLPLDNNNEIGGN